MSETKRPAETPAISLSNIAFTWTETGYRIAVDRFDVRRAERVLLLGRSGGGKSTLLGLICGISTPSAGRVEILGTDLATLSAGRRDRFRAEHIGVIFQMFNLLPYASARENVRLGLAFAPGRTARTADPESAIEDLLTRLALPDGDLRRRSASRLSTGQQQRVAAARALIGAPELIVADEPTSALDTDSQERFLELLFAQLDRQGSSLLMVSHDDRLAPRFDRVVRTEEILRSEPGS
ncbi:ABC transporter ATP-binding protein [Nisaea acidiphila]|uniref:ABC transporter ATP-binding protein n=1 Tax=Nisaea acidiphila TaxID=1862145 RepID=A0A9J7ASD6_9PROT|nr:ABC transporter ATP-binding protein [Nisaea acidiphila]UUX49778.1 ABC transporter ATP-binding protein [Nisaea acidiphila]